VHLVVSAFWHYTRIRPGHHRILLHNLFGASFRVQNYDYKHQSQQQGRPGARGCHNEACRRSSRGGAGDLIAGAGGVSVAVRAAVQAG